MKFRNLTADDIEVRVQSAKENGCALLLYKNARCDMNILDETVGAMNWQRSHNRDNANCVVSLWDEDKNQWISKEDTGTESNTEAEKGLASDSFKRACFNWGIGRELYTSPFIWISAQFVKLRGGAGGKWSTFDRFRVKDITIENHKITHLVIENETMGKIAFEWSASKARTTKKAETPTAPKSAPKSNLKPHRGEMIKLLESRGINPVMFANERGITSDYTDEQYAAICEELKAL